jgi:hypothetical protein
MQSRRRLSAPILMELSGELPPEIEPMSNGFNQLLMSPNSRGMTSAVRRVALIDR